MEIENNIVENKGKIKINELKIEALINILVKEGVVTKEEVEEELNRLVEESDKGKEEDKNDEK